MTEPDFRALRDHLENTATQPAFDVISGRRHQRTRRLASLGAASLVIVVLAGIAWAIRGNAGKHEPPIAPPASKVTSVTSHPAGTLFALDPGRQQVFYSTDRGYRWRLLGPQILGMESGNARLAAANGKETWMVAGEEVFYVTEGDWMGLHVGKVGDFSVAKERLWLIADEQVQIWTARTNPVLTKPLPAPVVKVAALSAEAAMVMTQDARWYYTYDSGENWHLRSVPCASSDLSTTMVSAPDRSLWLICDINMFVSTDDGETWASRGPMGSANILYPVSKTMTWRTDQRARIYRALSGGPSWSDVPAESGGVFGFSAVDADTAIRISYDTTYVTRDGGLTWTPVTLPAS